VLSTSDGFEEEHVQKVEVKKEKMYDVRRRQFACAAMINENMKHKK
jgi:hypothetical protein